jgi:hypothetical protein
MNQVVSILAAAALFSAAPAAATITLTTASVGSDFAVDFGGQISGRAQPGLSAAALFRLDSVSTDGRLWGFSVDLANTSTAPISAARITGFGMGLQGFSAAGNAVAISGASAGPAAGSSTGPVFGQVLRRQNLGSNVNVPELGGIADVCFMAGSGTTNNCSGGGNGGLGLGGSASQSFTLRFADRVGALDLFDFFVRYQSIAGGTGGTSGVGEGSFPVDPGGEVVPEPSSWAMLIAGFGLMGAVQRRRRVVAA